jgi:hypothetical protein
MTSLDIIKQDLRDRIARLASLGPARPVISYIIYSAEDMILNNIDTGALKSIMDDLVQEQNGNNITYDLSDDCCRLTICKLLSNCAIDYSLRRFKRAIRPCSPSVAALT